MGMNLFVLVLFSWINNFVCVMFLILLENVVLMWFCKYEEIKWLIVLCFVVMVWCLCCEICFVIELRFLIFWFVSLFLLKFKRWMSVWCMIKLVYWWIGDVKWVYCCKFNLKCFVLWVLYVVWFWECKMILVIMFLRFVFLVCLRRLLNVFGLRICVCGSDSLMDFKNFDSLVSLFLLGGLWIW